MAKNYVFSLEPTFTQGLILGQLSIILLLGLILKYIFLDSSVASRVDAFSYQSPTDTSYAHQTQTQTHLQKHLLDEHEKSDQHGQIQVDWLNTLMHQIIEVYRSKLRDDLSGPEGDEVARLRVENYANKIRPQGFLDYIRIHSLDLGISAPKLLNSHVRSSESIAEVSEITFDTTYEDTVSVSLSTSYLFNYPFASFARLPVSLTISLSRLKSRVTVTPPMPTSPAPVLTFSISPDFVLDLITTSLMGSRAKLANVPKLHELIEHQLRRIVAARGTWKVALPGLANVALEVQKEMQAGLS